MVLYRCEKCGYETNRKGNYITHLKRKKPCSSEHMNMVCSMKKIGYTSDNTPYNSDVPPDSLHITPINENISQDLDCIYCGKKFTRKDNLTRHLQNRCVVLRMHIDTEKEELKQKVENLEKQLINKTDNVINNINNSVNTQINNITINGFGNENISYITGDLINKYLELPYSAVPNLLETIHFNPEHPENHNLKITNKKEPFAKVYEDKKWILKNKNDIIEYIRDKAKMLLDNYRDEDIHSDFKNNCYNEFSSRLESEDKELIRKIFKDIELLILNNSDKI